MGIHHKIGPRAKRFIVDTLLEPLLPQRRLESWLAFCARLVVQARKPFIICITGSVGKSTTTAMIAAVLSHRDAEKRTGSVGATFGNMNDDVGVPATLLRFDHVFEIPYDYPGRLLLLLQLPFRALRLMVSAYPQVMVLECGAGWGGSLQRAVAIAPPDVAVVTTIGAAHLEKLITLEGVAHEKGAIVRAVSPSGLVILGQGHDHVHQLEQSARATVVKVAGQGIALSQNIARAVCLHMSIPEEVVNTVMRDFKSPQGRLNQIKFVSMTVIDDTYNANPLSMKFGLDTLAQAAGPGDRRLAIMGVMAELGEDSSSYHEEVGLYARSRADLLIGIGELSRHYKPDFWFETSDACAAQIESLVRDNDCLLVKGSASAKMGQVVRKLCAIAEKRQAVAQSI